MAADFTGQILDQKYLIKELLGEGGMGAVYSAEHISMGKRVAVKFLHAEFVSNEEVVKRFFREARAAASISHRNIIDVMDMGVASSGEPFLVMEYLVGAGLDTVLENKLQLDLPTTCAVMTLALSAIGAAHQKGIVHRDLKPENIFISLVNDNEPDIKLIDFGISKFQDKNATKLTVEGTTLGTPAYMSPEQARGAKELNHTTDIYSTGIILYQLLSGDTPFVGEQYNELLVNILTTEPRNPKDVFADFPMKIWPVIEKAISKQPDERYQTAGELKDALDLLCSKEDQQKALPKLGAYIASEILSKHSAGRTGQKDEGRSAQAILSELVQDTLAVSSAVNISDTAQGGLLQDNIEMDATNPVMPAIDEPVYSQQVNDRRSSANIQNKKNKTELVVKIPLPSKETVLKTKETVLKTKNLVHKNSKTLYDKIKYLFLESAHKKQIKIASSAILLVLFSIFIYSLFDTVEFLIRRLPDNAIIIYNSEKIESNPFDVKRGDTPVRLSVSIRGRVKMRVNIVPSEDKIIVYSRHPRIINKKDEEAMLEKRKIEEEKRQKEIDDRRKEKEDAQASKRSTRSKASNKSAKNKSANSSRTDDKSTVTSKEQNGDNASKESLNSDNDNEEDGSSSGNNKNSPFHRLGNRLRRAFHK